MLNLKVITMNIKSSKQLILTLPLISPFSYAIESINHDSVQPITNELIETVHKKFMPWVDVEHGCDYQAAINNQGEVSAGLAASGRSNGDCESMQGQVYARSTDFDDGTTAIMYAYYFAKDHAFWGGLGGHRNDWENIVVWIDDNENVIGAAYSSHGSYSKTISPLTINQSVVADYKASYTTHSFFEADSTSSISQENLVSYENLTTTIQSNLSNYDWGSAVFPLKESDFFDDIAASRPFTYPYTH